VLSYKMAIALRPQICDVTSPYVLWLTRKPIKLVSDMRLPRADTAGSPSFRPMSVVAKRSPISAAAELLLRTAHACARITVHNCRTQHSTEQFW